MSAHVLLIFNKIGAKTIKCKACRAFYHFFEASLMC